MSQTRSLALIAGAAVGLGAFGAFGQQLSSDEVRAIVAEMMADAESRTSLLAADGGHDGSFFLAGDGFELRMGGQVQFRYLIDFRDENGNDDDFESGFQTRRTKLWWQGKVHDDWNFRVQANFESDGGAFVLEDAYGWYAMDNGWNFAWGQFKAPVTRETLVDSKYQLAVERSGVDYIFSGGRVQGLWFGTTEEDWSLDLAFSDGAGSANSEFSSAGEGDYAFTGRFQWKMAGTWEQFEDFTSEQGAENAAMFGAALHYQTNTSGSGSQTGAPGDTDVNTLVYTADLSFEGDSWNAFGAFYGAHSEASTLAGDTDVDDFGIVVQGGYRFSESTEVFGRWEALFLDDERGISDDNFHFITVGVNQYYAGHAAKATMDVVFALEESDELVGLGLLPDAGMTNLLGDVEDSEVLVRFQFQLLF